MQLAQPERPVVCVIGEGSLQYAVTALWSTVAHKAPITILVLRNEEYAILKWFAEIEGVEGAPGLDLPALNSSEIANAYGIGAPRIDGIAELSEALAGAISSPDPQMIEVPVAPGMALA